MIQTNNDKLITYLNENLFNYLEEADQETFDNAVNVHGLSTGFIDFYKKDIRYFGDAIINTIQHVMNHNLEIRNIDIFVLQIYEDRKVKKTYYIKPQNFEIPLSIVPSGLAYTLRSENGSFPELGICGPHNHET